MFRGDCKCSGEVLLENFLLCIVNFWKFFVCIYSENVQKYSGEDAKAFRPLSLVIYSILDSKFHLYIQANNLATK